MLFFIYAIIGMQVSASPPNVPTALPRRATAFRWGWVKGAQFREAALKVEWSFPGATRGRGHP